MTVPGGPPLTTTMPLVARPTIAILVIVTVIAASAAIVARGGWAHRLGPTGQESVLAGLTVVPVLGVYGAYLLDLPTDPDALLFLAPISLVAAITLPTDSYRVGRPAPHHRAVHTRR